MARWIFILQAFQVTCSLLPWSNNSRILLYAPRKAHGTHAQIQVPSSMLGTACPTKFVLQNRSMDILLFKLHSGFDHPDWVHQGVRYKSWGGKKGQKKKRICKHKSHTITIHKRTTVFLNTLYSCIVHGEFIGFYSTNQ